MYLFRGGFPKPEEQEAHMNEWMEWINKLSKKGIFAGGEPFDAEGKLVNSGGILDYRICRKTEFTRKFR